jgi:AcrR family transcriptional regulator
VYRYFENRDALNTAYVHRETYRVLRHVREHQDAETPGGRLVDGIIAALHGVRESRALSSWFASTQQPLGGRMAERSEVIRGLAEAFLGSLGVDDVEPRARWLVRVIVSLLVFPGRDEDDERAMLRQFAVPSLGLAQHAD